MSVLSNGLNAPVATLTGAGGSGGGDGLRRGFANGAGIASPRRAAMAANVGGGVQRPRGSGGGGVASIASLIRWREDMVGMTLCDLSPNISSRRQSAMPKQHGGGSGGRRAAGLLLILGGLVAGGVVLARAADNVGRCDSRSACGVHQSCPLGRCIDTAPASCRADHPEDCPKGDECVAGVCKKATPCTPACGTGYHCAVGACVPDKPSGYTATGLRFRSSYT